MTELINLTPHDVNLNGVVFGRSSAPARVSSTQEVVDEVELPEAKIQVFKTVLGSVVDLPDPSKGVIFLVSRMVASAAPSRSDLAVPGPLLRDENGVVIGSKGIEFPNA